MMSWADFAGGWDTTPGRQSTDIRDGYFRLGTAVAAAASTSRLTQRHTFTAAFGVSFPPLRLLTPSRVIASATLGQDCSPLFNAAAT